MSDTATGTRALDRAADLVATVVHADEPMTFADLQDASGLAKSTTSRMLTALERSGLLERDAAGSYVAGRLFWLYAARHDPWEELVRLARPVMEQIGEDTGETVHLSVARGDRVVQVAQVDSTYLLGTRDWTEVDVPAHCSALGKVFLAWDGLALPRRRPRAAHPRHPGRPRRPAPRRRTHPRARLGADASTSSRSGSPASPSPSSASTATSSLRSGSRGPRPGWRDGSTSSAVTCSTSPPRCQHSCVARTPSPPRPAQRSTRTEEVVA